MKLVHYENGFYHLAAHSPFWTKKKDRVLGWVLWAVSTSVLTVLLFW